MLTVVLALSACAAPGGGGAGASAGSKSAAAEPQKLTAQEAHDRMTGGGERVILDVRTAEEYAEAHIPGAILLPNEDIGDARPAELPVLDTEILIYCRSGNRSAQAAEKLAKLGYTNLYDFGGINDWTYDKESGPWQPAQKEGTLQSFTAYDLSGVPVDESVFAGHKLTMINIWATFCGPCLREMPELGQLARDYADHGVQIIGMVADVPQNEDGTFPQEQVNTARELVKKAGADYLHLLPSADLVRAKLGQVSSVPETIFVDEKGNLVGESYVGARSGEAWGQILDSLLTEAGA
jgi:rhodanese-related sulfurtransferase